MDTTRDPLKKDPRFTAIALFLAAATLAKTPLVAGATVGDLAFVAGTVVSARWVLSRGRIARSRWNGLAVTLVLWAMASGVLAPLVSTLEFSDVEFLKSALRLSVLVTGAVILGALVEGASREWIGRMLLFAMTFNAAIAVGLYVAAWLNPTLFSDFGWLDRFIFSVPSPGGTTVFGIIRAQGLFNEPSLLGLFQTLGMGYLAFVSRDLLVRFDWRKILVLISIALTLSLGAYALLLAIGAGLVIRRTHAGSAEAPDRVIPIITTVVALAIAMVMLMQLGTGEVVLNRLTTVVAAQDLSAAGRLLGSWDVAYEIAGRSPLVGSGLGNLAIAADGIGYTFSAAGRTLEAIPSWNLFALSLGTMGVVGLVLYSLLVFELGTRNLWAGATIALAGFVTGGLLVATVWVFFALYAASYRPRDVRGEERSLTQARSTIIKGTTSNAPLGRPSKQTGFASQPHSRNT